MVKNFFLKSDKSPKNIQIKKDIITHFITSGNDTIAELAKELDLSVPTVTKFIAELTDQGLIDEFGKIHTAGGRHPSVYGLKPSSAYFLGVDMTRHHLNIALMDFTGNIVSNEMGIILLSKTQQNRLTSCVTTFKTSSTKRAISNKRLSTSTSTYRVV